MQAYLKLIQIPNQNSRVHKEECMLCYDDMKSESGVYICMTSFQCYCSTHVKDYQKKTGKILFINRKQIKQEKPKVDDDKPKPTKLAIGVKGGFDFDSHFEWVDKYSFVAFDPINQNVPLPSIDVPMIVGQCFEAIVGTTNATTKQDKAVWDGTHLADSIYTTNLQQDEVVPKIPPSGWKCSQHDQGCKVEDNLWLCLTCGAINCGRRNWDGSGGNDHGVHHFEKTHHPIAVKLGTITAEGGDVFSYQEGDLVKNPNLTQHLLHFGINIADLKKTTKSMMELELDANNKWESNRIEAVGKSDKPLFGPHLTGIKNIGNSCYLASVMQCMFAIPEFKALESKLDDLFAKVDNPSEDLDFQLAKMAHALASGKYSQPIKAIQDGIEVESASQVGISPKCFKQLVGKGHVEFSTSLQQDAMEFTQHLLTLLERNATKTKDLDYSDLFKFKTEARIECGESHKVKYSHITESSLVLPVPLDNTTTEYKEYLEAVKKEESEFNKIEESLLLEAQAKGEKYEKKKFGSKITPVTPVVDMNECLNAYAKTQVIEDFYSSAIKKKTHALKTNFLETFPDYLIVCVSRFIVDGWVPKKLNVSITNVDTIDLSKLRAHGLLQSEELLPEDTDVPKPYFNATLVAQLQDMGFDHRACEKACIKTNNAGMEQALEWIMSHLEDPDLLDPIQVEGTKKETFKEVDEGKVAQFADFGFGRDQAILALGQCDGNVERAIEWIFSHQDEIPVLLSQKENEKPVEKPKEKVLKDGKEQYELFGVITHIGSNTTVGHYVCFVKVDGKWVRFNDDRVESVENPAIDLGYLYFYKRK